MGVPKERTACCIAHADLSTLLLPLHCYACISPCAVLVILLRCFRDSSHPLQPAPHMARHHVGPCLCVPLQMIAVMLQGRDVAVERQGDLVVLTGSNPEDENTFAEPFKVGIPVRSLNGIIIQCRGAGWGRKGGGTRTECAGKKGRDQGISVVGVKRTHWTSAI